MKHLPKFLFLMFAATGAASAAPLTDNLVAYWNFEGNAANHAAATGGAAYNGTLVDNAAVSGTPRVGTGALNLDGTGDYMDVGSIVNPDQAWSVQAWFRAADSPPNVTGDTGRYFVFESSLNSTISFGLRGYETATLPAAANTRFQAYTLFNATGPKVGEYDMADTYTAITWHHYLLVFTPPTATVAGGMVGYLDGKARHTLAIPAAAVMGLVDGFHVGTYRSANARWFKGSIDEVAIWNRSLTSAEALDLFYRGQANQAITDAVAAPPLAVGMVGYYPFEETGAAGLANKAPGATAYAATRGQWSGTDTDWATGADATGPGFAGNAAYTGEGGTSNRATLLVGKALNLSDARNEYANVPLGTPQLGQTFTISAWHALTPGAANLSNRYHVFEPGDTGNYDVSWGTNVVATTTGPAASYTYLAYLASGTAGGFGPAGVSTGPWHHVVHVITNDGTKSMVSVYLDGAFVEARTEALSAMSFTSLNLGRARPAADDRDWDGMLDEVALWNVALSPSQVQDLYARGQSGQTPVDDKITVSLSVTPAGSGSVSGAGGYDPNTAVPVAATASPGYLFVAWTGTFAGRPAEFTYTATAHATATATFAQDTADTDADGLTNYEEIVVYHTLPADSDTDNDGIPDGAEVKQTATNPVMDDSALVTFVRQNLNPAAAGAISIGTPVLERDPLTGAVSLTLAIRGSADQSGWSVIPLNGPAVSITVDGTNLNITLPAPSAAVDSYLLMGGQP